MGGSSVVVGAQPVPGSHTPAIPRHQTGKTEPGYGRREVVANAALMLEEFGGYHSTDRVATVVLGPAVAAPVSIKAGEGVCATRLQFPAKYVAVNHPSSIVHQRHGPRPPLSERATDVPFRGFADLSGRAGFGARRSERRVLRQDR